jgi:hypothetical protein
LLCPYIAAEQVCPYIAAEQVRPYIAAEQVCPYIAAEQSERESDPTERGRAARSVGARHCRS